MKIRNWKKFQHFKDRCPPWIKLYRELLDDPDWHDLDDACARTLMELWLLASEDETHEGLLPSIRKITFRLRISEKELKQRLNKLSHWVEQDDIAPISPRYQVGPPETETETETQVKTETEDEFEKFWSSYPKKVAKKRAKKAFINARMETTFEAIIHALSIDVPTWRDEKFIPHPATWLNDGRYLDHSNVQPLRAYRPPGSGHADKSRETQRSTTTIPSLLDESQRVHNKEQGGLDGGGEIKSGVQRLGGLFRAPRIHTENDGNGGAGPNSDNPSAS